MLESFMHFTEANLIPLGALGVFSAAFLEEVVAPIPSAAVMMASGFFFLKGAWSLELGRALVFTVAIPVALGVTIGSLLVYGIAFYAGKPALLKWGKWFGVSWKDIEEAERRLGKTGKDDLAVLALRVIPVVPSVAIAALCGLIRFDFRKYLAYTFIGAFLRGIVLGVAGWQLGNVYVRYADSIDRIGDWILYSAAGLALAFVLAHAARLVFKRG